MPRKRSEKPKALQKLERSVAEILVAHDAGLKPFIHSFHHEPENIAHRHLGALLGIFEVEDRSKDSAYIVNFLASVAKKEYFINPKRPAVESLEAALHKVNVALSELIKHDNTAWLGRLNAAVCVLEKNNLHFSVAGKARTLLLRGNALTDISEGLAEDFDEPHPLKTFTEVASGRLNADDRILVTTPALLDILSLDEIQRNAQRLPQDRFFQFLRTVSVNQLSLGGTLVVDIFETDVPVPEKKPKPKQDPAVLNAFSQTAFTPKRDSVQATLSHPGQDQAGPDPESERQGEYTDTKTGHIYVQGEKPEARENEKWNQVKWALEERALQIAETVGKAGAKYRKQSYQFLKKNARNAAIALQAASRKAGPKLLLASQAVSSRLRQAAEKAKRTSQEKPEKSSEASAEETLRPKDRKIPVVFVPEKKHVPQQPIAESSTVKRSDILKPAPTIPMPQPSVRQTERHMPWSGTPSKASTPTRISPAVSAKFRLDDVLRLIRPITAALGKILPRLSRIKETFRTLDKRQKAYALGALLLMVALPFFFSSFGKKEPVPAPAAAEHPQQAIDLAFQTQNKIRPVQSLASLATQSSSVKTVILDDTPYLVGKDAVQGLGNPSTDKAYRLPEGSGSVLKAAAMDDLNTIFLLTDTGKLFSFTPSNHVFAESNTSFPDPTAVEDMASYLTYLYVADSKNGTVYRYPRAEGGFGEKTVWLKDTAQVAKQGTIAINENLYLGQTDKVLVFLRGKQIPFALPTNLNPLTVTQVFTYPDAENIYILDAPHKRIVKLSKTGELVAQYTHDKIAEALAFAVDESGKTAYFNTSSEALSFTME
jgi:hypothetical protein